jgi:hypothetical protein
LEDFGVGGGGWVGTPLPILIERGDGGGEGGGLREKEKRRGGGEG